MTVHLLRGAGSYTGVEWRQRTNRPTMPLVNCPPTLATACGSARPSYDVTDDEAKVTCGSCRRASEYGTNWRAAADRQRARQRAAAMRIAARNAALCHLVARHADEFVDLYEGEHTLIAIGLPAGQFPTEVGLPPPPRNRPLP